MWARLAIVLCLFVAGCELSKEEIIDYHKSNLPPEATNIISLNNEWSTCEFRNRTYLFHAGRGGFVMVEVEKERK